MATAFVIDRYYLTISLLITLVWQCLGFFVAWTLQFDKITDFTGGSNFFILALITLLMGNTFYARNIVASVFVMIWAARLAGFLLFRVLKTGSDTRFDDIRSHFLKFAGFWLGQIVWVWVVSLPTIILNSPAVSDPARGGSNPPFGTATDVIGIILFAVGLGVESLADIQKYRYKSSHPPRGQPCTVGLWKWSRHPPYFGEIVVHWGLWLLSISPSVNGTVSSGARSAQYGSVVAPLFTMVLLLFGSGIPTAEKPTAEKYFLMSHSSANEQEAAGGRRGPDDGAVWHNYKEYLARTSILVPLPPAIYRPLPHVVKTWLLFDLPVFKFDERVDGKRAIEREERKQRQDA